MREPKRTGSGSGTSDRRREGGEWSLQEEQRRIAKHFHCEILHKKAENKRKKGGTGSMYLREFDCETCPLV